MSRAQVPPPTKHQLALMSTALAERCSPHRC